MAHMIRETKLLIRNQPSLSTQQLFGDQIVSLTPDTLCAASTNLSGSTFAPAQLVCRTESTSKAQPVWPNLCTRSHLSLRPNLPAWPNFSTRGNQSPRPNLSPTPNLLAWPNLCPTWSQPISRTKPISQAQPSCID